MRFVECTGHESRFGMHREYSWPHTNSHRYGKFQGFN